MMRALSNSHSTYTKLGSLIFGGTVDLYRWARCLVWAEAGSRIVTRKIVSAPQDLTRVRYFRRQDYRLMSNLDLWCLHNK